ncbi:hypothetical protein EDB19DRAFT_1911474 [Suillus lakei]|nr:hypothetical protein EDB19DRAFT_1911474 [Suillus lakei]
MTSISSVSLASSSESSFICDQPFSRPVLPAHCRAYWEAIVLDTQFAMRLDSYICRTNDQILMNIVDAFHAADNLTPTALELQGIPEARFSADVVSKLEEEEAFNAPPDPARVVPRPTMEDVGPNYFPIQDFMRSIHPTFVRPIVDDSNDEVLVEPPTPPAEESNEAGAALDEILRLTTEAEEAAASATTPEYWLQSECPNDFVSTTTIPHAVLDTIPAPASKLRKPPKPIQTTLICGKFAPGHLTTYCPTLAGKCPLFRRGPSSERFYQDLKKLEAAFDQDAARIEQDKAENEIEALEWLADTDLDLVYYNNMDD